VDPTSVPTVGIPWLLAAPAFIFLCGLSIAVVKWIALGYEKKLEGKEAQLIAASAEKEKVRADLTAKIDALESEVQAKLQEALDAAHAALRGTPRRPAVPPPGVVRRKQSTRELLESLGEVTGQFSRRDLIDDTQELGRR